MSQTDDANATPEESAILTHLRDTDCLVVVNGRPVKTTLLKRFVSEIALLLRRGRIPVADDDPQPLHESSTAASASPASPSHQ